ncbi:DgyrCDS8387 [Dimorphilus gyrociliatus]|uniref:V-type proton ATPase subunit G n=1 Tax=Dimorphilus gyrociliatus TaxID=2664684 RepID=A0A7I8VU33_9ANNE|nr:DgyrCDS8387 [Dimorphilus gyrociliatus]
MASQSTGIQQLLAAEKRAAEKVSEARKRKARRLKQAKEEAQAEIDSYKQEREQQYRQHEANILGSKGDSEQRIDKETQIRLSELERDYNLNKEKAFAKLLTLVCDIKPQLHINYKPPM